MAGGLAEGDPAALSARSGDVAHQPPTVVEVDDHLGVTWEGMGTYTTHQEKTNPACSSL